MTTIITSPGYTNSGPNHWQTHLEEKLKNTLRVQQQSWTMVERNSWIEGIQATINRIESNEDILIVGHSCGSVAAAQWACERPFDQRVKAMILVAPADVESSECPPPIRTQSPLPRKPIPYPTLLITSNNDPFLSNSRALEFSNIWQVEKHCPINSGGHLASDDGYGEWEWICEIVNSLTKNPPKEIFDHIHHQGETLI